MPTTDIITKPQEQEKTSWDENLTLPPVHRITGKETPNSKPDQPQQVLTNDEARELATQGLKELNEALRDGKSQTLEKYLSFMAKFHNYSFNNCMLIAQQFSEATHVAGYAKWKKMGRNVKKGEKAIRIFAPTIVKDKDNQDSKESPERKLRGFRVAKVFDISQTEGKEIPEFATIEGDPGEALSRMEQIVKENNIELTYDDPDGGAMGISSGGKITVRPDLPPAEKFSVLVHEAAHEFLHRGERRNQTNHIVRETEAEAVAYTVCRALGIDSKSRSSDYIALHRGDTQVLSESLKFIQKTASYLIGELMDNSTSDQFT